MRVVTGRAHNETVRRQAAAVLRALKAYRGLSDPKIASAVGMSPASIQAYMTNKQQLTVSLMAAFAAVLHVDPRVFFLTPDEALRWTIDNAPNEKAGGFSSTDALTEWWLPYGSVASPAA